MDIFIFEHILRKNAEKCIDFNYDIWYNTLDKEKKARYNAAKTDKLREQIVLSDAVCRAVLAKQTGLSPCEMIFAHGKYGKPMLQNGSLNFNVTHSGNYIAVCTDTKPCGIDIEINRKINIKTAKRFCRDNELQYIESSTDPSKALLYIWTRKEAYFKALGCGIATLLTAVDSLNTDGFCTVQNDNYTVTTYSDSKTSRRNTYVINPENGNRL